jgi:hypothetical protein
MVYSFAQTALDYLDISLTFALCVVFFRASLRKNYPSMFGYLCVRSFSAVALVFLLHGPLLASQLTYQKLYFVIWWANCLVSSVLLFLVCLNTYRQAMTHLPGLARMGTTVFAWGFAASLLVTATSFNSPANGPDFFVQLATQLMRSTGTVQLCLLAFLTLCMKAIDLPLRSRPFGIAFGLGILALNDCLLAYAATVTHLQMNAAIQIVSVAFTVFALGLWLVYALMPEPARKPITLPVNSTIYRWNQIASALGHKGTQIAMQPEPSFFLSDVEKVVERAFVRTLNSKEAQR